MIDFKNIERYSFRYYLLKVYGRFLHRLFYKRIEVSGLDNIPKEGAVIFAPNHQNALMDALAVLYTTKGQPVFLARADIFKKRFVARLLRFIKIMPVYRIRDGKDSLQNNETIFEQCVRILSAEKTLILLPEGNHSGYWRLRPLKKGLARIAFQAQKENQYQLPMHVVPVGLNYSNYQRFRSKLLVNFGKPINVQEFYTEDEFKEAVALNQLTKRLAESIKPLMIHINSQDHYDTYKNLVQYCDGNRFKLAKGGQKLKRKFDISKKLVRYLEHLETEKWEAFEAIENKVNEIGGILNRIKIKPTDYWMRKRTWPGILIQSILLILGIPFFLAGMLGNLLVFIPPKKFSDKLKDRQFVSSIRYGFKVILVPLAYLIVYFLIWLLTPLSWWISLLIILSLPFLGIFAFDYTVWVKNHLADWRVLMHFHKDEQQNLREQTSELFSLLVDFDQVDKTKSS